MLSLSRFWCSYAVIRINNVRSEGYLAVVPTDLGRYGGLMFSLMSSEGAGLLRQLDV